MAKSSNFDFSEFEKYVNDLPKQFEIQNFLYQFLGRIGLRIIAKTKDRTPVITGNLKNAWDIGEVTVDGNELSIEIINNMEYASYVEWGAPNVNGTWRNGRYMLTISVDEVMQQVPVRFENEFNQFLKNKGVG